MPYATTVPASGKPIFQSDMPSTQRLDNTVKAMRGHVLAPPAERSVTSQGNNIQVIQEASRKLDIIS